MRYIRNLLLTACFIAALCYGFETPSRVSAQTASLMFGSNGGVPQAIKSTNNALWVSVTGGSTTLSSVSATDTTGVAFKTYLNTVDGTNFTPVLAGAGAGNVTNGVHSYKFTLTDVNGETTAGAATPTVNVVDKTVDGKVTVKLPDLANTSQLNSIKIYRTAAGGSTYLFLAEVTALSSASYTDNIADASLGAAPPSTNTAFGTRYTFMGEWLLPTTGVGDSNIPTGNVLLIGDPRSDTQLQNAIAVHDAFSPTGNGVELDIYSGNSVGGHGGDLTLTSGSSTTSTGGNLTLTAGNGVAGSSSGTITLSSSNQVKLGGGFAATKITNGGSGYGTLDAANYLLNGVSSISPTVNDGRLTLTSGKPVGDDNATSTSIFYTPMTGNRVSLFTSSVWQSYVFTEISIPLGTLVSATNYDIFLYDSGGSVTAKIGPAWTSNTARGSGAGTTELIRQNGSWVNKNSIASGPAALAGKYVGTFRTISTTATEDSGGAGTRFLYNQYNQVLRDNSVHDATASWSYTGDWRQARAQATNQVVYVSGEPDTKTRYTCRVIGTVTGTNQTTNSAAVSCGVDSTTVPSGFRAGAFIGTGSGNFPLSSWLESYSGLGFHTLAWIEKGAGASSTFLGENGTTDYAGLTATMLM
jgi:hypothetical protein